MEDSTTTITPATLITATGKRSRDECSDESPDAAKRLQAEILDILDDVAGSTPDDAGDLATVMRSLEEEIGLPSPPYAAVVEEEAGSTGQQELGYLLEASDDELGLPPTTVPSASGESDVPVDDDPETVRGGLAWGFGSEGAGCYDAFDIGFDGVDASGTGGAMFTGVFLDEDYSDALQSDLAWRPEHLPAV